jgi:hypothetical protein
MDDVAYFNQARILDKITYDTVSVMPMIPGTVAGDFNAGRSYPWSGSAVIMPIKAPYTAPVTILICGGATFDRVGLATCVSISPGTANPQWVIEQMVCSDIVLCGSAGFIANFCQPSPRVLACIVSLGAGPLGLVVDS